MKGEGHYEANCAMTLVQHMIEPKLLDPFSHTFTIKPQGLPSIFYNCSFQKIDMCKHVILFFDLICFINDCSLILIVQVINLKGQESLPKK